MTVTQHISNLLETNNHYFTAADYGDHTFVRTSEQGRWAIVQTLQNSQYRNAVRVGGEDRTTRHPCRFSIVVWHN